MTAIEESPPLENGAALSDRLREAAEWLADDLPEGVVAPQFLEGDVRLDELDAYCVERLREAADERDRVAAALADLERDAARWRALMRCGRIKMQGSSGIDPHTGERNGNDVHFGAEFWPEPCLPTMPPDMIERYRASTAWGVAALGALADAIIEREDSIPTSSEAPGGQG